MTNTVRQRLSLRRGEAQSPHLPNLAKFEFKGAGLRDEIHFKNALKFFPRLAKYYAGVEEHRASKMYLEKRHVDFDRRHSKYPDSWLRWKAVALPNHVILSPIESFCKFDVSQAHRSSVD